MVGSIERQLRRIAKSPMLPMMMIIVGVNAPDPNRRNTGYGGVLPVPGPTSVSTAAATRLDPMLNVQHREARIQRGRVLYAAGHAPAVETPKAPRTTSKAPCPQQRVVQSRSTTASPNT